MAPRSERSMSSSAADCSEEKTNQEHPKYKREIIWKNVAMFFYLHLAALYGFKLFIFDVMWLTFGWTIIAYYLGAGGVTAGAHRLWTHRSYKAKLPLRIFLCFYHCMALQNHLYDWCRNHRVHHKFSETDADPHNAKRGFFFSHMGWLMCKKHPDVKEKGKSVDMGDLLADPVVAFQVKHYYWLAPLIGIYYPMAVAHYGCGETWWNAFFVCFTFRYVVTLHSVWSVNSFAHLWGDRPYDKDINPTDSMLVLITSNGEGFHNYHHTFPWDYKASEWGWKWNIVTFFIDLWARFGLAYDLKTVPQKIIDKRRLMKGDGSNVWYPEILDQNRNKDQ